MKKVIIGIVVFIVVLIVIGMISMTNNTSNTEVGKVENSNQDSSVKSENDVISENEVSSQEEENDNTSNSSKILIAFFSRADENYKVGNVDVGNTEIMAGFMKDYFGDKADIFKIDPVKEYPKDYKECTEVAAEERDADARPEFKGDVDILQYDTIFLRISSLVAVIFQWS